MDTLHRRNFVISAEDGNENDPYAVAVMKDGCCWPMIKACACNQGVLILENFL